MPLINILLEALEVYGFIGEPNGQKSLDVKSNI